jgi:hemolysin-activating ACP:hemolysin acyltransferase
MMDEVIGLMAQSNLHRNWFVHDLTRLILPPISSGQYVTEHDDGKLVGLATIAYMDDESFLSFINGERKICSADFNSGSIPVLMDVIAPHGNGRSLVLKVRKILRGKGLRGTKIWYIRRYEHHKLIKASVI